MARWVMVRLDEGTHAALCRVRASMLRGVEHSQRYLPQDDRSRTSLNAIVTALIAEYRGHLERARKQKRNKRAVAFRGTVHNGQVKNCG